MKRLNRFFDYIVESVDSVNNFTKEKIEELLESMVDIDVVYSIMTYDGMEKSITEGDFSGRKYIGVSFDLVNLVESDNAGFSNRVVGDDKVWEFLDELITFKNRLNSDKVWLYFTSQHKLSIGVYFLTDSVVDSDLFELEKFYNVVRDKSNRGTTNFYYGLIIKLDRESKSLSIECHSEYTDRKLNNLFSGLDLTKFDIKKEISDDYFEKTAKISVTLKS